MRMHLIRKQRHWVRSEFLLEDEETFAVVTPDDLLGALDSTAVTDSFALYNIATSHSPRSAVIRAAALRGEIRLIASSAALAVSSAMRDCWDYECVEQHTKLPARELRSFHEQGGFELSPSSVTETIAAGQSYAKCTDHRLVGAEVLASCSSILLAKSLGAPLLSTGRGAYCYGPKSSADDHILHLV
ncbi:hypothetical protein ACIQB4_19315 [Streptomyces griseoluteus]|uniref:hypothetical protein n=1 Tax=Streptomyces griseoluteus TaxID=29306 RepID=UPI0037FEABEC